MASGLLQKLVLACMLVAGSLHTSRAAEPLRPDGARVRQQVEEVLSDPRYQRGRPDGTLPKFAPEPPKDFDLPDLGPRDFAPSAASGVSEALLWVLLGGFGAAVLAVVIREGMRWASQRKRRPKKTKAVAANGELDMGQIALERLPASLARARALAAEGRYEEAVHMLLEGALGYLHALANFSLEPAYTSREVLARAPLTSETRHAFKDLVMTVEVSLFGGFAVDDGDFGRCESSFVTLHQRLGGTLGD